MSDVAGIDNGMLTLTQLMASRVRLIRTVRPHLMVLLTYAYASSLRGKLTIFDELYVWRVRDFNCIVELVYIAYDIIQVYKSIYQHPGAFGSKYISAKLG